MPSDEDIEVVIVSTEEKELRELSPLQWFSPASQHGAPAAERGDYRPTVMPFDNTQDRVIEDGQGNTYPQKDEDEDEQLALPTVSAPEGPFTPR